MNQTTTAIGSVPTIFAGHESLSFAGLIDDLRFYNKSLSEAISKIYNLGGGDYQTIEIIGAGSTRITANQMKRRV